MPKAPVRVLIASRSPAWSAGIASFLSVPPLTAECAHTVDGALARLRAEERAPLVAERRPWAAPQTVLGMGAGAQSRNPAPRPGGRGEHGPARGAGAGAQPRLATRVRMS